MHATSAARDAGRGTGLRDGGLSVALAVVGLSFLWPCLGSSATMHFRHAMVGSASLIATDWHAVVMGALYLVAIALCLAARPSLNRLLASPALGGASACAGLVGLVGHLLLVASPLMGDSAPVVTAAVLAGFAMSVAFIVAHILAWGTVLERMPVGRAVFAVGASNALSYALQLAVDVAAGRALLGYLVVCPVFSGLLLYVSCRRAAAGVGPGRGEQRAGVRGDQVCEGAGGGPGTVRAGLGLRNLPWKFVVPIVALIYFEQALTSLLFQRYADWPRDNLTLTLAVGCLIWLAASVYLRRSPVMRDGTAGTGATVSVLFAGLVVIYMAAMLVTIVFPTLTGPLTERLLVAAGSSFRVLLWISIACTVGAGRLQPLPGYLVYVLFVLAVPVSRFASLVFEHAGPDVVEVLVSPGAIVSIAGVGLFLMAAAFAVLDARDARVLLRSDRVGGAGGAGLADRDAGKGLPDGAGHGGPAGPDGQGQAYLKIAGEHGLSARETEVLGLVCHGYSARHAGQRLGISESTVVSHMTHIYRKLGVSSKQELVELVEGDAAADPDGPGA